MKLFSFTADAEKYWSMLYTITRLSKNSDLIVDAVKEMSNLENGMRYEGEYTAELYNRYEKEFLQLNNNP